MSHLSDSEKEREKSPDFAVNVNDASAIGSSAEVHFLAELLGHKGDINELNDPNFHPLLDGALRMDLDEAKQLVVEGVEEHNADCNFPHHVLNTMKEALEEENDTEKDSVISEGVTAAFRLKACAAILTLSSPYPDVRANASSVDNPAEYCETVRAYFIGTIWLIMSSFMQQFFTVRKPAIELAASVPQLLSVPTGWFLAAVLPDWGVTIRGTRHSLNPGPWSYKEQCLVTVMYGVTQRMAYTETQVLVQKLPIFYDNAWAGAGFQLLMILSTQFMGLGLAGFFMNVIIYPSKNLFPINFPLLALNRALLTNEGEGTTIHGWKLTRWQFFTIAFTIIFLWQWVPLYLAEFTSDFNWITWIAPNNFNLATVAGTVTGIGFTPLATMDWSYTSSLFSPLASPFFSFVNVLVGAVLGGLMILGIFYSNAYNTGYLPINSNKLFTNEAASYNVSKILTADKVFDETKFQAYSPPYFAAANVFYYGAMFAAYTCILMTQVLYDWSNLVQAFKDIFLSLLNKEKKITDYKDVHCNLMRRYKGVPFWWYLVVMLISLALSIACVRGYPTEAPVWSLFLSLGMQFVFFVPVANLFSRTGNQITLNVLSEILFGYAKPGYGTATMLIRIYATNTGIQACYFLSMCKFGLYAKVAPRALFRAMIWSIILASFVTFGCLQFQLQIDGICTSALAKTSKFTCPKENTFFSASVLWGTIGPKRVFDKQYPLLKWAFLIGCAIPVPLFLVRWFSPKWRRALAHVDVNLMLFGATETYAPYNLSYVLSGFYVNFFFMFYVRRRFTAWFEKYNYVLAAALSAGSALCALIVYFSVQYHPKDLEWWGNTVSYAGLDDAADPLIKLAKGKYFGPAPGDY